ncbi:MAG: hypothetical protein DRO36_05850 [Candidatus Hecatellales archaeon]|nr:MAG: hypothetical protein DRO36_05850 [Candidatus Hecatellales archaeon]
MRRETCIESAEALLSALDSLGEKMLNQGLDLDPDEIAGRWSQALATLEENCECHGYGLQELASRPIRSALNHYQNGYIGEALLELAEAKHTLKAILERCNILKPRR